MPDPTDLVYLTGKLKALRDTLYSGSSSVSYAGRSITYRSTADLRLAIVDLEAQIAGLSGIPVPRRRLYRITQSGTGY